jgi:hypothetical protein
MKARKFLAALLFAALPAAAAVPAAQTTDVVEFYNKDLDHYFMTADANEIKDLDTGVHAGWARTGFAFKAIKAGEQVPGSTAICRFYGKPEAKLDSHFYSASMAECDAVKAKFPDAWLLESTEVFRAFPVDVNTGKCVADSEAVFRLWNKRSDVNHRYTTQLTVYQDMVAKGYVAEGNGNPQRPVIFCMPAKDSTISAPPGTPACTVASSSSNPLLGTPITLTATCTNSPTSYNWQNCVGTGSTCIANSTAPGVVTYSVTGVNATGAGNTAKTDVTWTSSGGPIPICTISASNAKPLSGSGVTLTANCSQTPTRFDWMTCNYLLQDACNLITSCSNSSQTCTTNQAVPGYAHYALEATNSAGRGPRVGVDVEWLGGSGGGGGPPPSQPVCTLYSSSTNPTINSTITLTASCNGNPTSYAWTNCTSSGPTCTTTKSSAGAVTYQVVASNTVGNGAPATVTVNWGLPAPPSCTLSASDTNPTQGGSITLTANCSGSPTNYTWTNCASSSSTCTATNANAGIVVYTVAGVNAAGSGNTASVNVNWQPRPTSPPVCTVTTSNGSPFTGMNVTLTANCSNSPTSYQWTNCVSSTSTCIATSNVPGTQTYTVAATNVVGTSTPASVNVSWQQSITPPDFCSQYRDVVQTVVPWGSSPTIYTKDFGPLKSGGIAVVAVVVPSTIKPGAWGRLQWAEYIDPRGNRQVTLSRSPCDFRGMDPSGQNGPLVSTGGVSGDIYWNLGNPRPGFPEGHVVAGQTYYVNLRQTNGCGQSGRCDMVLGLTWQ